MDALELIFSVAALALGAVLFALRDRLGAQAVAEEHGVTPLAYGVMGAILVAAGTLILASGF